MVTLGKTLLLGIFAIALLAAGFIAAQYFWHATHHRYDHPDSGYYYGGVSAHFRGPDDDIFLFSFSGQSEPHWRWLYSTNVVYRSLQFNWWRNNLQGGIEGTGTVSLPSLAYKSSQGTGVLTTAQLSQWLLGTTNGAPEAKRSVNAVFAFINDAARGTLPAPRHHTYYFEEPVSGSIQHFSLGYGVGGYAYIWIATWLLVVVIIGRLFWGKDSPRPSTAPSKPSTTVSA